MTNLEGIARKLLREGATEVEIQEILEGLLRIFKDKPQEYLSDFSKTVIEEVRNSDALFHNPPREDELNSPDILSTVLQPVASGITMGEGGVGCRGEGDNLVHHLLGQISETSIAPFVSPLSLDDAGAVRLSQQYFGPKTGDENLLRTIIVTKMEGIHSRLSDFPFLAGFHVTRALLRDIYVKGAVPVSIMVDVHLADDGDIAKLFDFQAGIAAVAELAGVPITAGSTLRIGGDFVIGDRLTGGVAGIGVLQYPFVRENIQPGDQIIMVEGSGGGTISTTALYQGDYDIIKETLNLTFLDTCQKLLSEKILAPQIHAMIDVTNGGLRNDLLEISQVFDLGFRVDIPKVESLVNRKVLAHLKGNAVDFLGVSLDSLVIFCPPHISGEIISFLGSHGIRADHIGHVVSDREVIFHYNGHEEKVTPKFREAAYTPLKKFIDQEAVDFNTQKLKIQAAFTQAMSKRDGVIAYLKSKRAPLGKK